MASWWSSSPTPTEEKEEPSKASLLDPPQEKSLDERLSSIEGRLDKLEDTLAKQEKLLEAVQKQIKDCTDLIQRKSCSDLRQRNLNLRQNIPFPFSPDRRTNNPLGRIS